MATQSFYIGSYTIADDWIPNARGQGITRLELDLESGGLRAEGVAAEIPNPSYLAPAADGKLLYACSELFHEDGRVWAFVVEPGGDLRPVSERTSMGRATCHVSVDAARNRVFAASYLDGRVVAYEADGAVLAESPAVFEYHGTGPNQARQESSHPHQVVMGDGEYFVPDLGADRIWIHDAAPGSAGPDAPRTFIETPPGCGPRHLVFHPELPLLYVVCELEPRVLVYERRPEAAASGGGAASGGAGATWAQVIDHPCELPASAETAAPAAIKLHPSGRSLTVSNRFSDSLQQFTLDPDTGRLSPARNVHLPGKTPRDFGFSADGSRLIALCQDSNEAFSYPVDPESGVMSGQPTDRIEIGTPVCVVAVGG